MAGTPNCFDMDNDTIYSNLLQWPLLLQSTEFVSCN